ncbi:MAG: Tim44 domain-containing protein [Desulfosoma sp.]|uniref:Tim44 domain-containing protein n=1 Tax=Desulfosoma sp. TaxID=2603217 RepID=UPI00404B7B59
MMRRRFLALCGLCVVGLFLWSLWADVADAARFGGGKSFGSRPSYQRSTPAPSRSYTTPQRDPGSMSGGAIARSPLSSPMRSWGGMLGGLLMGGLLGSLLFGGTHAWGGPSLLDLLVIGGALFLLFRFLKARRLATSSATGFNTTGSPTWANTGGDPGEEGTRGFAAASASSPSQPRVPQDFDAQEFMEKAKALYVQLQEAWDRRDMEAIRPLVSLEVFEEIQRQAQEDAPPSRTHLLWINPELLEVRELDGHTVASVLFDVMMRETDQEMAKQVRELWHFRRHGATQAWIVEGLQQVAG